MPDDTAKGRFADVLASIRSKVQRFKADRSFNEQNTKASLIVPLLHALGWDTNDPDEVHWEYKLRPKDNPVDFALLLQRTPCLLIEAKALRENLDDDRLVTQILTYATVAGVQWVVLTNGNEYRIYNASAPIPVSQKLFKDVTLLSDDARALETTLGLLSKQNLQDRKIARLWESHFVDRQVHKAIDDIFNPSEPSRVIIHAINKHLAGKLKDSQIRASLRRARVVMDFPEEPESATSPSAAPTGRGDRPRSRASKSDRSESAAAKSEISVETLIREGLLPSPAQIFARYRGRQLSATVEADGTVTFDGERFASLSVAGGKARDPWFKGKKWGKYPSTNGWTFWQVVDPISKNPILIDALRDRYLQRKKDEAKRFGKPGSRSARGVGRLVPA